MRECLRTLRAGRVLGMLVDVDLQAGDSVQARFLGLPVSVPLGPARLARRTGAAVVAGFVHRDGAAACTGCRWWTSSQTTTTAMTRPWPGP